jgi:putative hydrolase of the HAD superfamily
MERFAIEYECRVNPAWPMPGIAEVLRRIRDAGRPLGIISNAQFFTPLVIEALLGEPPATLGFRDDLCVYSYERLEAKPSTRLFEGALDRLAATDGLRPEQVLYVGNDVRNDVRPAAALGCRTALFAGDQRSWRPRADDPGCAGVEPDAVLHRLDELPAMLEGA